MVYMNRRGKGTGTNKHSRRPVPALDYLLYVSWTVACRNYLTFSYVIIQSSRKLLRNTRTCVWRSRSQSTSFRNHARRRRIHCRRHHPPRSSEEYTGRCLRKSTGLSSPLGFGDRAIQHPPSHVWPWCGIDIGISASSACVRDAQIATQRSLIF